jgi:serine protease Do
MSTSLSQLSEAIRAVGATVLPAVVRVEGGWRPASGIVVAPGRVLTNAHNVTGGEAVIRFTDGRTAQGSVAGVDADGDLALITVDTGAVVPLTVGAGARPELGDLVLAIGAGREGGRVTLGTVSGLARSFRGPRGARIDGSLEHTAPMAPGSSGSALVDAEGHLVGINTHRTGAGFYLAIPADAALEGRIEALARGDAPGRPRLGVALAPDGVARRMRRAVGLPDLDGALVRQVDPEGPAARAGIAPGDLIVRLADVPVGTPDALADALAAHQSGAEVRLVVVRGADERTVGVVLADG